MRVVVRQARIDDIDWILKELEKFSKQYGTKKSLYGDEAYCREGLKNTIQNHVFLLAERDTERLGFIAGFVSNHPYNPSIRLLTEFFWWVAEEHRHSRAGLLLLDEYIAWGKANCDWITFGITEETLIKEETLTKRGFSPIERTFLMEGSQCQPSQSLPASLPRPPLEGVSIKG